MRIDGVSRIDSVEPSAITKPTLPVAAERISNQDEGPAMSGRNKPAPGRAAQTQEQEPVELTVGSGPQTVKAHSPLDSYARIRFDEGSGTILIQIVDSASGEVMREIPPETWAKHKDRFPLPKGVIVEKER